MNIDCDKITEDLEDSEDELSSNFQKILILRVVQHIFCELLIGGGGIVNSDLFFLVTNIRTNVQNNSSEFEGLIHEMVSLKIFSN